MYTNPPPHTHHLSNYTFRMSERNLCMRLRLTTIKEALTKQTQEHHIPPVKPPPLDTSSRLQFSQVASPYKRVQQPEQFFFLFIYKLDFFAMIAFFLSAFFFSKLYFLTLIQQHTSNPTDVKSISVM